MADAITGKYSLASLTLLQWYNRLSGRARTAHSRYLRCRHQKSSSASTHRNSWACRVPLVRRGATSEPHPIGAARIVCTDRASVGGCRNAGRARKGDRVYAGVVGQSYGSLVQRKWRCRVGARSAQDPSRWSRMNIKLAAVRMLQHR